MLWHCTGCTTAYSVGAPRCPHCGSTEYTENPMPKTTRHGGPSNRYLAGEPEAVAEAPVVEFVDDDTPLPEVVSSYEGMLRADLQKLCDERGLPTYGNKAELVARLLASDEAEPDVEPEPEGEAEGE